MKWVTTTQILEGLKSSNNSRMWSSFSDHFRPLLVSFGRRLGLSAADAEDATQETMAVFVKSFRDGKYDREKGQLSGWLFGIARRVILNIRGKQPLEQLIADKTTGTSFWDLIQDDHTIKQSWETEWQRMVLGRCLEQVSRELDPKVYEAFELYALSEIPVEQVAQQLNVSKNAVYIAKSRVLSRLRELECRFE